MHFTWVANCYRIIKSGLYFIYLLIYKYLFNTYCQTINFENIITFVYCIGYLYPFPGTEQHRAKFHIKSAL